MNTDKYGGEYGRSDAIIALLKKYIDLIEEDDLHPDMREVMMQSHCINLCSSLKHLYHPAMDRFFDGEFYGDRSLWDDRH